MAYISALFVVLPHCKQETVPVDYEKVVLRPGYHYFLLVSVVGVSLLLAGDTELSRSVGGLTTALLFITACRLSISSLYCFFSYFIFVSTCAGVQWKFLFFSSSASFVHTGAFLYVPNNSSWFATLLHRASKHLTSSSLHMGLRSAILRPRLIQIETTFGGGLNLDF